MNMYSNASSVVKAPYDPNKDYYRIFGLDDGAEYKKPPVEIARVLDGQKSHELYHEATKVFFTPGLREAWDAARYEYLLKAWKQPPNLQKGPEPTAPPSYASQAGKSMFATQPTIRREPAGLFPHIAGPGGNKPILRSLLPAGGGAVLQPSPYQPRGLLAVSAAPGRYDRGVTLLTIPESAWWAMKVVLEGEGHKLGGKSKAYKSFGAEALEDFKNSLSLDGQVQFIPEYCISSKCKTITLNASLNENLYNEIATKFQDNNKNANGLKERICRAAINYALLKRCRDFTLEDLRAKIENKKTEKQRLFKALPVSWETITGLSPCPRLDGLGQPELSDPLGEASKPKRLGSSMSDPLIDNPRGSLVGPSSFKGIPEHIASAGSILSSNGSSMDFPSVQDEHESDQNPNDAAQKWASEGGAQLLALLVADLAAQGRFTLEDLKQERENAAVKAFIPLLEAASHPPQSEVGQIANNQVAMLIKLPCEPGKEKAYLEEGSKKKIEAERALEINEKIKEWAKSSRNIHPQNVRATVDELGKEYVRSILDDSYVDRYDDSYADGYQELGRRLAQEAILTKLEYQCLQNSWDIDSTRVKMAKLRGHLQGDQHPNALLQNDRGKRKEISEKLEAENKRQKQSQEDYWYEGACEVFRLGTYHRNIGGKQHEIKVEFPEEAGLPKVVRPIDADEFSYYKQHLRGEWTQVPDAEGGKGQFSYSAEQYSDPPFVRIGRKSGLIIDVEDVGSSPSPEGDKFYRESSPSDVLESRARS